MNILLVSAATPTTFWSFEHVLSFISKKAAFPPLGLLTVASMLPDSWNLKLVDLNVTKLTDRDIKWADYIFVSAMIVQADSASEVITRCKSHDKPVVAGGPLFTTGHERFPEVDHFVLGESEELMPQLVADMEAGQVKPQYHSESRPDVTHTPIPKWDLINLKHYATMPLQFSRGCPFDCEFCDVIIMNGRTPRVKQSDQMLAELDSLVAAGWKEDVFIVDDNFVGNRRRVKEFLRELIKWQQRRSIQLRFTTEVSLTVLDDPELLDLMSEAGFNKLFIGIESPQEDSLLECAKLHNAKRDLPASVRAIQNAGFEVMGGFIIGFDSDKPTIFEAQMKFIQETGIVTAMVGLLTALPGTRLFQRLKEEGRILSEATGNNVDGILNFVPRIDRDQLVSGYRNLVQHLYTPKNYYDRILVFLQEYKPRQKAYHCTWADVMAVVRSWWIMGVCHKGRREYWKFVSKALIHHRKSFHEAMRLAIIGHHFRKVAASL
jgi:radical SAM superfamily enzyme YgiQ (UPF0313 family)